MSSKIIVTSVPNIADGTIKFMSNRILVEIEKQNSTNPLQENPYQHKSLSQKLILEKLSQKQESFPVMHQMYQKAEM